MRVERLFWLKDDKIMRPIGRVYVPTDRSDWYAGKGNQMTPSATLPREAKQKASTSRHRLEARALLALTMLAVIGGTLIRRWDFSPALARSPDERTYTRQSNTLLTAGTAGLLHLAARLVRANSRGCIAEPAR
jgi:hypothetical protein